MAGWDMATLLKQQAEYDDRKAVLLSKALVFRDGLLERLELFASRATEAGLRGVTQPEIRQRTEEAFEVRIRLAHRDVILAMTDSVYQRSLDSEALAVKLLGYLEDSDEARPFVAFVVHEALPDEYRVHWTLLTSSGTTENAIRGGVTKHTGREAADSLISTLYTLTQAWKERPTLGAARDRTGGKRRLGFLAHRDEPLSSDH